MPLILWSYNANIRGAQRGTSGASQWVKRTNLMFLLGNYSSTSGQLSYCSNPSDIVLQLGLDPTYWWYFGVIDGEPSMHPKLMWYQVGSAEWCVAKVEPQLEQKNFVTSLENLYLRGIAFPSTHSNFPIGVDPYDAKAEPLTFLQIEQWQNDTSVSSPDMWNSTSPHVQLPLIIFYITPCSPANWERSE